MKSQTRSLLKQAQRDQAGARNQHPQRRNRNKVRLPSQQVPSCWLTTCILAAASPVKTLKSRFVLPKPTRKTTRSLDSGYTYETVYFKHVACNVVPTETDQEAGGSDGDVNSGKRAVTTKTSISHDIKQAEMATAPLKLSSKNRGQSKQPYYVSLKALDWSRRCSYLRL